MNEIGVPPHPQPWPTEDKYDPELLANGDRRNVLDKYRYWQVSSIKADLDATRFPLEIAIENVSRDFNMGTIVRTANALNVSKVHIVGKRQWNKRGAMVTDHYMNIEYHESVDAFISAMTLAGKGILAIDIVPGAVPLAQAELPSNSVLVFGSEKDGLSKQLQAASTEVIHIEQFGSTRSVNVGVAAGIVMYEWVRRNMLTR